MNSLRCLKIFNIFMLLTKLNHFGHQNEKSVNGLTLSPLSFWTTPLFQDDLGKKSSVPLKGLAQGY